MWSSLSIRAGRLRIVLVLAALAVANPALAQRVWAPPVTISPLSQNSSFPRLAMDGNGNAVATWTREPLTGPPVRLHQVARMTGSGFWGPVSNLYALPSAATFPVTDSTDVALNATGRGAAVWVRATGAGAADQMVQAAIFNGLTWATPSNLLPSTGTVRSPRVGVDADGNAIAVWIQVLNGFTVVRASRFQAFGTWTAAVTVSAVTENVVDQIALDVDEAGAAVALWTAGAGGVSTIRAAQFSELTGQWTAPVPIASAGRAPSLVRLAMNRAGTVAFAVYRGSDGADDIVRACRLDTASGTWSPPADLSAAGQEVSDLDVATDEAGRAIAIWTRSDGTVRGVETARYDRGSWGPASNRTTGVDARDVTIDTDDVGNAVAVWARRDGTRYRLQGASYRQNTDRWAPPLDISDATADASAPRVRLGASGTAVAVWQSLTTLVSIQASRLVLETAPQLQPATVRGSNVTLNWTPGTGGTAGGFTVIASRTPGGPPALTLPVGTQTSVSLTAQEGAYYVRVDANVAGEGAVTSNEIQVVVGRGAAPEAPGSLAAEVAGNVVALSWTPPANAGTTAVQTYYISAGSEPGKSDLAFFPTGSTETTYITAPIPNGSYWVRVRALGGGGIGEASNEVRVVVGPPPPGAPSLSGTATGAGVVQLQWSPAPTPGAPVTGYQLRAGLQPGLSNAAVLTFSATTRAYSASGIPRGTYYVRIVPLSTSGPGEASNELTLIVP